MHSSQYSVPQHGVLTASRKSLLSIGHTRVASIGVRSRMSAAVNPFGRETCFCHEALNVFISGQPARKDIGCNIRVRLSYNITSFRRHHYSLSKLTVVWMVNSLEETPWYTGCSFDARLIIELAVIVSWTVMYPVTFRKDKAHK